MPKLPTVINFSKYRTRHLYLKYYDNLKTHLGHFEHNLIGLGYALRMHIILAASFGKKVTQKVT